jgi:hypothetical protein
MSPFIKPAIIASVLAAAGIGLYAPPATHEALPGTPMHATARPQLDATSDVQARQMRRALLDLAGQTGAGARCRRNDPRGRYVACAVPSLRRAGMGGQMAARVLNAAIAGVPFGPCKTYLLGLQAAAQAAGDQARWLLPNMYGPDRRRAQHEVATQLAQITHMLHRAARAAPAAVCSVTASGPAA